MRTVMAMPTAMALRMPAGSACFSRDNKAICRSPSAGNGTVSIRKVNECCDDPAYGHWNLYAQHTYFYETLRRRLHKSNQENPEVFRLEIPNPTLCIESVVGNSSTKQDGAKRGLHTRKITRICPVRTGKEKAYQGTPHTGYGPAACFNG